MCERISLSHMSKVRRIVLKFCSERSRGSACFPFFFSSTFLSLLLCADPVFTLKTYIDSDALFLDLHVATKREP